LGDGIRRMLKKIGENSLWAEYSYKGRKGKRAFQQLLINDAIIRKFKTLLKRSCLQDCKMHKLNVIDSFSLIEIFIQT